MTAAQRISPREDKLLVLLARYLRVTVEQATRHAYSPNSLRHVRNALNHLIDLGYVDSYKGFSQGGNPPLVYSLSTEGWRYVDAHYGMPIPQRWKASEVGRTDPPDFHHDRAITDVGIAIERFCREAEPAMTFVQFLHDRFLPQTKIPLPDGTHPAIRLDAFVELHIQRDETSRKRQRCHLIEIDRGTHYKTALRKKFLLQLQYMRSGLYQRDFETTSLSYLWVCPNGHERVKYLKKLLEVVLQEHQATELSALFLFTGEDPAMIDPAQLFLQPVWFAPFADDPVTLLALPSSGTIRLDHSHYLPQGAFERFLEANGEAPLHVTGERDLA